MVFLLACGRCLIDCVKKRATPEEDQTPNRPRGCFDGNRAVKKIRNMDMRGENVVCYAVSR